MNMYSQQDMENHVTFCPQANRLLDRGVKGELRTAHYLYDKLDPLRVGDYRILMNYNFPMRGANTLEVDLVVITSFGIFLLEVKNWLGTIEAFDDAWFCNGERRENVFTSVSFKAKCIHTYLRHLTGLPFDTNKVSVTPLIILVQGTQTFKNRSNFDSSAVVGLNKSLLHALSSTELLHRREHSQRLSNQDIITLHNHLYRCHDEQKGEIIGDYRLLKKTRVTHLFEEFEAQNIHVATQHVRIKCYHLQTLSDEQVTAKSIEQFKRSIEVVSSLGYHPNIVQTLNFFPDSKYYDLYYEVTEFVNGKRLDEFLEQRHQQGHSLSLDEQINMLKALCQALQFAHNHKDPAGNPTPVYHRNVSFESIFLDHNRHTNKDVVKLADFNFAKFGPHTLNPMYWKIPAYQGKKLVANVFTAPETLKDASKASARSDIYALGVLWYFLARIPEYNPGASFDPGTDIDKIKMLPLPDEALKLLESMVAYHEEHRPKNIEEVLNA